MSEAPELLPCPFCGGQASLCTRKTPYPWIAKCDRCGATAGGSAFRNDQWNAHCWNTRTDHVQTLIAEAVAAAYAVSARAVFRACTSVHSGYRDENERLAQRIENELRLEVSKAIRARTPADAQADLEARDKRVKQSVKPSERFHEEQVQVWAQEILEGLAMSDLIKIDTYDDKVTAHRIVASALVDIGKALDILCHIHADDSGEG